MWSAARCLLELIDQPYALLTYLLTYLPYLTYLLELIDQPYASALGLGGRLDDEDVTVTPVALQVLPIAWQQIALGHEVVGGAVLPLHAREVLPQVILRGQRGW